MVYKQSFIMMRATVANKNNDFVHINMGDELTKMYYTQKSFNLGLNKGDDGNEFNPRNVSISDICEYTDIEYNQGLGYLVQLFTRAYNSEFFTVVINQDEQVEVSKTFKDAFKIWSSITHVELDGLDTDILIVYNHLLEEEQRLKEKLASQRGQPVEKIIIRKHRLPLSGIRFIIDGKLHVVRDDFLLRKLIVFLKESRQLTNEEKNRLVLYFFHCIESDENLFYQLRKDDFEQLDNLLTELSRYNEDENKHN